MIEYIELNIFKGKRGEYFIAFYHFHLDHSKETILCLFFRASLLALKKASVFHLNYLCLKRVVLSKFHDFLVVLSNLADDLSPAIRMNQIFLVFLAKIL